jgi:hypothetical protein
MKSAEMQSLFLQKKLEEILELAKHDFVQWKLNRHTKTCRQLINKLIELF